jgi:hypothetical protein
MLVPNAWTRRLQRQSRARWWPIAWFRIGLILVGHMKLESTIRYLGIDLEDAVAFLEATEI